MHGNSSHGGGSKGSAAPWQPPANFALVEPGVYRSAYPSEGNVPYLLHKRIRTLVLLSIEKLPATVHRSLTRPRNSNNSNSNSAVRIVEVAELRSWSGGAGAADDFSYADVHRALDLVADTRRCRHPVLLACPTGELQTSVVVGCMRRLQQHTMTSICSECELFVSVTRAVRPSVLTCIAEWQPSAYLATSHVVAASLAQQQQQQQRDVYSKRTHNNKCSDDDAATSTTAPAGGDGDTQLATWFARARAYRRWCAQQGVVCDATDSDDDDNDNNARRKSSDEREQDAAAVVMPAATNEQLLLPPPHVRYARVRNPPALDERSTFTKESLVEEDDD